MRVREKGQTTKAVQLRSTGIEPLGLWPWAQLADPATRQGTGLNACGGQGMKGTKLCDRNLERGDGSKVSLLHEGPTESPSLPGAMRDGTFEVSAQAPLGLEAC